MRVTHKVDYGLRVTTALAVNESTAPGTSVTVRVSLRSVLETVTLADLACGTLPRGVRALLHEPGAWDAH